MGTPAGLIPCWSAGCGPGHSRRQQVLGATTSAPPGAELISTRDRLTGYRLPPTRTRSTGASWRGSEVSGVRERAGQRHAARRHEAPQRGHEYLGSHLYHRALRRPQQPGLGGELFL